MGDGIRWAAAVSFGPEALTGWALGLSVLALACFPPPPADLEGSDDEADWDSALYAMVLV
jgi:hypothetical protein